ncbi:MAG: hypothetical protein Sapg2KO_28510 [Saprospiraceae bacterium]
MLISRMLRFLVIISGVLITIISLNACQSQPYPQGEILYNNFCANCHMDDGSGLAGNIPPLAQADYLKNNPLEVACIINKGMTGAVEVNGQTYNQPMAAIPQLSEFEITNVINYINHAWGNDYGIVKLEDVRAKLKVCD